LPRQRTSSRSSREVGTSEAYVAKRAEIVAAAAALFVAGGVARVSMDDIADAAGLAKPSLYHYFSTRDEILFAINEQAFNFLFERTAERSALTDDPELLLRGIFEDTFALVHELPGYSRVVFEHLRHLAPEFRSQLLARRKGWQKHVQDIVEAGIASGAFRPVDSHEATLAILGMINWSHQWYSPRGARTHQELAHSFFDLLMGGMRAAEAVPPARRARSRASA
jgi:TetR/AcrR family transcriptional regulator, cholesterol catabolism regulator